MRTFRILGREIFSWGSPPALAVSKPKVVSFPSVGSIKPDLATMDLEAQIEGFSIVKPDFMFEIIPIIRHLAYYNPDVSQALDNIVQLGNTGHTIQFDASVNELEANEIHSYLNVKKLQWSEGTAGMDGLVNKMIAQVMIGGALSGEWVPQSNLQGVDRWVFLNPEHVRAIHNSKTGRYEFYQKLQNSLSIGKGLDPLAGLHKLNPLIYKYYAINGDTNIPYGIPPYLSVIGPLTRQQNMDKNIDFILDMLGVMGFLAINIEKPDKLDAESEDNYAVRLNSYLLTLKDRVKGGLKDGVVAGFKEDTEFEFHSITKDIKGVQETYNANELQVGSSLKQDMSLLGRGYGTTETQITVIFTKLLSQIKNIQALIKRNLEYGYTMDLRMAGFKFKSLEVKFNQSTVLDELKFQQALEVKIRNLNGIFYDGIISLDKYAQEMGYEKADQKEVRFVRNSAALEDELRQKAKDASDRAVRKKNKPQEKSTK
jgi:hypothetical protein